MSSELSNLLLLVIDKYERGSDDYVNLSEAAEQENFADADDNQQKVADVREATDRELKSKMFDSAGEVDARFSRLMATKPRVTRSLSVEEIRRTLEEARNANIKPYSGQEHADGDSQEQFPLAPSANLELFFAKELASRLDIIVSRVEVLEEMSYNDILSPGLRSLLRQAHRCYLYGFEAATAIMCGAVLEQTLKDRFGLDWKFEPLLQEAEDRGLLTPEQFGMGDNVRELRNDAVHDFAKFVRWPEDMRANILTYTRTVVRILLSENAEYKES